MSCGRHRNEVKLQELGALEWPLAMALFDALLDMTWLQAVPRTRHPLFARIKEELQLTQGVGEENYDGLLILAWLLASWPQNMRVAVECLEITSPRLCERLALSPRLVDNPCGLNITAQHRRSHHPAAGGARNAFEPSARGRRFWDTRTRNSNDLPPLARDTRFLACFWPSGAGYSSSRACWREANPLYRFW